MPSSTAKQFAREFPKIIKDIRAGEKNMKTSSFISSGGWSLPCLPYRQIFWSEVDLSLGRSTFLKNSGLAAFPSKKGAAV